MLALVSPAKKLDFESEWLGGKHTQPQLLEESQKLIKILKKKSQSEIRKLMSLSEPLGKLNYERYQSFSTPFTPANARPAVLAFRGDTYVGLDADTLNKDDLDFAQNHLGQLSGLYGFLKPLDLIQPYRLEMGTKLANKKGENLYDFWGDILTKTCNENTKNHKDRTVICLASNEYIKAIKPKKLEGDFITCHFKEIKNGAPKAIGLFAKRARGAMARYMIQNRIETPKKLQGFNLDGYKFAPDLSDEKNYTFTRDLGK